jgi:hypothetical protein
MADELDSMLLVYLRRIDEKADRVLEVLTGAALRPSQPKSPTSTAISPVNRSAWTASSAASTESRNAWS